MLAKHRTCNQQYNFYIRSMLSLNLTKYKLLLKKIKIKGCYTKTFNVTAFLYFFL